MTRLIIWDFDGTLAHHSMMWAGSLIEALDAHRPDHGLTPEILREHLGRGFPWHTPERLHPELSTPDAWWSSLHATLVQAMEQAGLDGSRLLDVARDAGERYRNPACFSLFDDVVPALELLRSEGWRHTILSNHVPELRSIVDSLELTRHVDVVVNSAETGAEKPHPDAFAAILGRAGNALGPVKATWMVGDSYAADVQGAEAAGIPAILVRTRDSRAPRQAPGLQQVASIILSDTHP